MEIVEVCLGCLEIFRQASKFIRHIELSQDDQHNNLCERKAVFIKNTCQELRNNADKILDDWERGKTRELDSLGTRPARRVKLDHPNVTIADSLRFQDGI